MSEEGGEDFANIVPQARDIPHYHGDSVRGLFVVSAIVLIVAKSTGAALPLSTLTTVAAAILLVVAAGITNPAQFWIHWINTALSMGGTVLFGVTAIRQYRTGANIFDISFIYVEALALLFLVALYFTTRTVRGTHLRPDYSR